MSRWWLSGLVVGRASLRDRRVTVLAGALVAVSVIDLALAWTWVQGPVVLGAWIIVTFLMYSAVARTAGTRRQAVSVLETCGAGAGIAPLVAVLHATLLTTIGSIVGIVVGLSVRAPLVRLAPPRFGDNTHSVVESTVTGAVLAIVLTALAAAILSTRHPRPRRRPLRRLWSPLRLIVSIGLLALGIGWVAASTSTFTTVELSLFVVAPILALGTVGLAVSLLAAVSTLLRGRGGAAWFVARTLDRSGARAAPVLALVAITVTACATGAILTSSLYERVQRASAALDNDAAPAGVTPDGPISEAANCAPLVPEARDGCNPQLAPSVLAQTPLALQDPSAEWVLIVAALTLTLPLVVIAVALDTAARADEDELLELQGADPSTRRRITVLTATVLSAVGSVTGVAVAGVGTDAAIAIYNNRVRLEPTIVFPPVPMVAPLGVLAALVVVVPAAAAAVTALTMPRRRSRPQLDLALRVEQPVGVD
jgi:predicted lysophospholipase L1 biosynthesis ABC-type transport system permease subunit